MLALAGMYLVTAASILKATYKLFVSLGVPNVEWRESQFFPNQSLGFLVLGISMACIAFGNRKRLHSFIPVMGLVGFLVLGYITMASSLSSMAIKEGKKKAVVFFVISLILGLGLGMGYLSSRDFNSAAMNWITQFVNLGGQTALWIGCRILRDGWK